MSSGAVCMRVRILARAASSREQRLHITPFHLVAFATAFAMVGVCTGLAQGAGADPLTVVTLRALGTVLLFVVWFRMAGVPLALPRRERAIAIALGIPLCINN